MTNSRICFIREIDQMWRTTRPYFRVPIFLLYINDLPQCLDKTKPRLFADDTNLTVSGDSITDLETAVNSDLEKLRKWLIANKLRSKCC